MGCAASDIKTISLLLVELAVYQHQVAVFGLLISDLGAATHCLVASRGPRLTPSLAQVLGQALGAPRLSPPCTEPSVPGGSPGCCPAV